MLRFTLRQLEYFEAVALAGTVAGAAADIHISRSAIAAALDDLERAVQAELFVRRRAHGTELTPAGRELLDQARSLLSLAADFEDRATAQPLSGPVAVGCFSSLAPTVLPTLLEQFSQSHPDVELNFVAGSEDGLVSRLRTGELEVAVMYTIPGDPSLQAVPLYTTRLHVVLAEDHPLAASDEVRIEDLAEEPLIVLDTPPSAEEILGYFHAHGVHPVVRHRTGHFELVRSLVARGLGFTLFIQQPKNRLSYEGRPVAVRPLVPRPATKTAAVVWPRGRRLSRKAAAFLELCQRQAAALAPPSLYDDGTNVVNPA